MKKFLVLIGRFIMIVVCLGLALVCLGLPIFEEVGMGMAILSLICMSIFLYIGGFLLHGKDCFWLCDFVPGDIEFFLVLILLPLFAKFFYLGIRFLSLKYLKKSQMTWKDFIKKNRPLTED